MLQLMKLERHHWLNIFALLNVIYIGIVIYLSPILSVGLFIIMFILGDLTLLSIEAVMFFVFLVCIVCALISVPISWIYIIRHQPKKAVKCIGWFLLPLGILGALSGVLSLFSFLL